MDSHSPFDYHQGRGIPPDTSMLTDISSHQSAARPARMDVACPPTAKVNALRPIAYVLVFASGAAAMYVGQALVNGDKQPVVAASADRSHRGNSATPHNDHEVPNREVIPPETPSHSAPTNNMPSLAATPLNPPSLASMSRGFRVPGLIEPTPDRFARVPLATSQAVAYIDVKVGDQVKKGLQLFSHWESPDRLQAMKLDVQKTKKLLELTETRLKSAEQNLARVEKLDRSASAQEREDAETAAAIRRQEVEAATLAVAEAERMFAATDFEFKQAFVTSPIDGIVAAVDVTLGERRQVGNAFRGVTVLDSTVLHCRTLLNAEQIATVRRTQNTERALPDAGPRIEYSGRQIPATVVAVSAIADAKTGLVPVTFEVPNTDEMLRVGIRVDVVIDEQPKS
jgi:multidrug efflux pump subunit AcrA (membrane-fusion protein)